MDAHSYLTDGTEQAVKKLEKHHGEFFKYLTVEVANVKDWTEDDVELNRGIFLAYDEGPPEIMNLESKLRNQRVYNVSRFHLG